MPAPSLKIRFEWMHAQLNNAKVMCANLDSEEACKWKFCAIILKMHNLQENDNATR